MALTRDLEDARRAFRRRFNLDLGSAILGDINGVVYEPGRDGWVRVRNLSTPESDTEQAYGPYVVVKMRSTLRLLPGDAVLVGYDDNDELAVLDIDFDAQVSQGRNPLLANPADAFIPKYISQSDIVTLISHAISTPATPSKEVSVRSFVHRRDNVMHNFAGEKVDLTAHFPGVSNLLLAGLFLLPDDSIEVVTSTSQADTTPLDMTDVQELMDASSVGSVPVWAWQLLGSRSHLTDDDSFLDMRHFINIDSIQRQITVWDWDVKIKANEQANFITGYIVNAPGSLTILAGGSVNVRP